MLIGPLERQKNIVYKGKTYTNISGEKTFELIDDNLIEYTNNILTIKDENKIIFTFNLTSGYYTIFMNKYLFIFDDSDDTHLYHIVNGKYELCQNINEEIFHYYEIGKAIIFILSDSVIIMDTLHVNLKFSKYIFNSKIDIAISNNEIIKYKNKILE